MKSWRMKWNSKSNSQHHAQKTGRSRRDFFVASILYFMTSEVKKSICELPICFFELYCDIGTALHSLIVQMLLLRSAVASNCSMFLQLIKWGSCPTERRLGLQVAPALDQSNSQIAFMITVMMRMRMPRIIVIIIIMVVT